MGNYVVKLLAVVLVYQDGEMGKRGIGAEHHPWFQKPHYTIFR
jgi:hypothetical protein